MISTAQQSRRKQTLKNVTCYTAVQIQENHQWPQISWRLLCPLAQRHWWQQMEIVHLPTFSPDADSLGARRAREFTADIIPPFAQLHELNLPWHSTISSQPCGYPAFLSFHIQNSALLGQESYQRLMMFGAGKPSMGTDCQSGVPGLWQQEQQADLK